MYDKSASNVYILLLPVDYLQLLGLSVRKQLLAFGNTASLLPSMVEGVVALAEGVRLLDLFV